MIYVIGIGPGDVDYLVPAAVKAVHKCTALAGGERALAMFNGDGWRKFRVTGELEQLRQYIASELALNTNLGILVSGDPGFYSLLPFIRKHFPAAAIEVVPGISSLQVAFCRAGMVWQNAKLTSVHGRALTTLPTDPAQLLGLLTGAGSNSPQGIATYLLAQGPNRVVFLGENLTYAEEKWCKVDLEQLAVQSCVYGNAVLIVLPAEEEEQ
ncbi:MAG: precorrin-6y C5,15-methyltransferase (decarboxylating) subunit CbiE [Peptococcaceae bacterium]|nr:precorrin-6y C5,15-methyltransferase (decarboxylating) subunit CbiE [Peptococcaceae bacterium]